MAKLARECPQWVQGLIFLVLYLVFCLIIHYVLVWAADDPKVPLWSVAFWATYVATIMTVTVLGSVICACGGPVAPAYKERNMKGCTQCEVTSINGVACHEQGCPNSHIDPATGLGYPERCADCGATFRLEYRGQKFCHRHRH